MFLQTSELCCTTWFHSGPFPAHGKMKVQNRIKTTRFGTNLFKHRHTHQLLNTTHCHYKSTQLSLNVQNSLAHTQVHSFYSMVASSVLLHIFLTSVCDMLMIHHTYRSVITAAVGSPHFAPMQQSVKFWTQWLFLLWLRTCVCAGFVYCHWFVWMETFDQNNACKLKIFI